MMYRYLMTPKTLEACTALRIPVRTVKHVLSTTITGYAEEMNEREWQRVQSYFAERKWDAPKRWSDKQKRFVQDEYISTIQQEANTP